jgi:hypothetical protein
MCSSVPPRYFGWPIPSSSGAADTTQPPSVYAGQSPTLAEAGGTPPPPPAKPEAPAQPGKQSGLVPSPSMLPQLLTRKSPYLARAGF